MTELKILFEEWKKDFKLDGRGSIDAGTIKLLEHAFVAGYHRNKVTTASALKQGQLFRKSLGSVVYLNLGTYPTQHGYIEGVNAKGIKTTVAPEKRVVIIEDQSRFFACKDKDDK